MSANSQIEDSNRCIRYDGERSIDCLAYYLEVITAVLIVLVEGLLKNYDRISNKKMGYVLRKQVIKPLYVFNLAPRMRCDDQNIPFSFVKRLYMSSSQGKSLSLYSGLLIQSVERYRSTLSQRDFGILNRFSFRGYHKTQYKSSNK